MDISDVPHYKFYRYLLLPVGLWPYQNPYCRTLISIVASAILIATSTSQFARFGIKELAPDHFICIIMDTICTVQYTIICIYRYTKVDEIKYLMDQIKHDWEDKTHPEEIQIMCSYADAAKKMNLTYFLCTCVMDASMVAGNYTPLLFDLIMPLNESRPKPISLRTDLFDNAENFYEYLFTLDLFVIIMDSTLVCNQVLFVLSVQHVHSLFAVLRYRLERIIPHDKYITKELSNDENLSVHHRIVLCIETHQRITELANYIDSCHGVFILLSIGAGIVIVGLAFVYLLNLSLDGELLFIAAYNISAEVLITFFNTYIGQKMTDISVSISDFIYQQNWYGISTEAQKKLLVFMTRSNKPCVLRGCKLFTLSMECFSAQVKCILMMSVFSLYKHLYHMVWFSVKCNNRIIL